MKLKFILLAVWIVVGSAAQAAQDSDKTSARDFYQARQLQWADSRPTDFVAANWKQAAILPWTALLGDQVANLPCVEEVKWLAAADWANQGEASKAAKVLRLRRDYLTFDLGFSVGDQLLWLAVHEDLGRGIAAQQIAIQPTQQLADQWPQFATLTPASSDQPPPPQASTLGIRQAATSTAKQRYQALLEQFQNAEALHFDATAVLKIAMQDQAREVGAIQMQMRFLRPGFGHLNLHGWIGAEAKTVNSQILGTSDGLVHVDHVKKAATGGGSLDSVAEGMAGFAPLAVWAGITPERALDVQSIHVPGHDYGWTGLQVETAHLISVYRFDPRDRFVGAAVVPKDSSGARQIMEYRFHGMEFPPAPKREQYQVKVPYPLGSDSSGRKQSGMLNIGESLPAEYADLSGAVLFFWLDSGPQQQQDLDQLRRDWREIERKHADVRLISIPASDSVRSQAFKVRYFPSFYVIGSDGVIHDRFTGWDAVRLQRAVRRLK